MPFLNCGSLGLWLGLFSAGHTVAMVAYCVKRMITKCSPMIGQCFDAMIVASGD